MAKSTAMMFGLLVLAMSVTCIVKAVPEYQKLQLIEKELADSQQEEVSLKRERRRYEVESTALKRNYHYLESRARDRLHYYRRGEEVIELD